MYLNLFSKLLEQNVDVSITHMLLQLLQFLPAVILYNLYNYVKRVKVESPGNSLPAGNVENSVEVVALDEQAAEGEQRQPRVLPDLQGLQVLGGCITVDPLLPPGACWWRRPPGRWSLQCQASSRSPASSS